MLGGAKRQIGKSISELSQDTRFAVIFGAQKITRKFPENGRPIEATPGNKKGASRFLEYVPVDGEAPAREDLLAALRSAESLNVARKTIIYIGTCSIAAADQKKILDEITSKNTQRVQINTFGIAPYQETEDFLRKLAAMNGGTFKRLEL